MPFYYQAFGFTIRSVIEMPELLPAAKQEPDLEITIAPIDRSGLRPTGAGWCHAVTGDSVKYYWQDLGALEIIGDHSIVLDPEPDTEQRLLRLPILGNAFATVAQRRGYLALHGSAVEINGGAAIFVAGKGWGKSTLAATLYSRGHRLLTDDLIVIDCTGSNAKGALPPVIVPGFPTLKLLPDALRAIGHDPSQLPPLAQGYSKRAYRELSNFSSQPTPVKGLYQLAQGARLALRPLTAPAALEQLIGNAYIARTVPRMLRQDTASQTAFFQQCLRLLNTTPAYRLERPQRLSAVSAIAQLIEDQPQHQPLAARSNGHRAG